jgi:hypothetical protein
VADPEGPGMKRESAKARVLAVEGHSRNIGKTSLAVDLIRAFPEAAWTAVKITQHGHGIIADSVENCAGAPSEHAAVLDEEHDRSNHTDTSRFLVAGASRALLLRVKHGRMEEALELLRTEIEKPGNVILESNTVLQFLKPSLYLVVLNPLQEDFKSSTRSALDQADAFVLRSPLKSSPWEGIRQRLLEAKPKFLQRLGEPLPAGLMEFVRERFFFPEKAE